jgi:hypothetical protein
MIKGRGLTSQEITALHRKIDVFIIKNRNPNISKKELNKQLLTFKYNRHDPLR